MSSSLSTPVLLNPITFTLKKSFFTILKLFFTSITSPSFVFITFPSISIFILSLYSFISKTWGKRFVTFMFPIYTSYLLSTSFVAPKEFSNLNSLFSFFKGTNLNIFLVSLKSKAIFSFIFT